MVSDQVKLNSDELPDVLIYRGITVGLLSDRFPFSDKVQTALILVDFSDRKHMSAQSVILRTRL